MADWGTAGMAAALPEVAANPTTETPAQETEKRNPQELGWAQKTSYDYATYNKTSKQLQEERDAATAAGNSTAVAGIPADNEDNDYNPNWAGSAEVYEWSEEYGDVGPPHPLLEEELFRSKHHIRSGHDFQVLKEIAVTQEGTLRIEPIRAFEDEDAGLHPVMLQNVKLAGYDSPTPIQAYCLPAIKKGYDIVACAQTGSGKTAAYLIPTLSKLMGKAKKLAAPRPNPATFDPTKDAPVRAEPLLLVLSPTRELATQIFDEARRFCYRSMLRPCVIYGGGSSHAQREQLMKGCDILIATPGRLVDFIEKPHILSLHRLKFTIIDEADELLQEDWEEEFNKIMSGGNQNEGNINYMMFSATFPKAARALASQHLANNHVRIRVGRAGSSHQNIQQDIVWVEGPKKKQALYDLIISSPPARTIIFVNSRRTCDDLDDFLFNHDLPSTSVHAERTQKEREDAIRAFRRGQTPIMITTGVGARGWDVMNVMHVINYDLPNPQYGGIQEYTHRIGRTGRIGNKGIATSFYNERDEEIGELLTKTLQETNQTIPDFLQQYVGEEGAPLQFESDDEDEGEGGDNTGAAAGGDWGAPTPAAAPLVSAPPAASGGWGTPTPAIAPAAVQPAPLAQPAAPAFAPPTNVPVPTVTGGWSGPVFAPGAQFLMPYGVQQPPSVNNVPPTVAGSWGAPHPALAPTAAPVAATAPGGWGAQPVAQPAPIAPSGWNAPNSKPAVTPQPAPSAPSGWNAPNSKPAVTPQPAPAAPSGWGAPAPKPVATPQPVPAAPSGWGAQTQKPVATPQPAPAALGGWGAPAPTLAEDGGWPQSETEW